ncbi:hypothetical protein BgiBS90_008180, partial [Biomphalaria glabrata]
HIHRKLYCKGTIQHPLLADVLGDLEKCRVLNLDRLAALMNYTDNNHWFM